MSNVIHLLTRRPIDSLAEVLPLDAECLACFVHRMVHQGGCTDGLRWVEHFRRLRAKRATALTRRLTARGATCDCSVTTVVWRPHPGLWEWDDTGELSSPTELPACAGVRPNSTQACGHWTTAAQQAFG
jgi:hypothetical protein